MIRIGIVGRLTEIKNHKLFLDMADELLFGKDNVEFYIVGDGELKEILIQYTWDFYGKQKHQIHFLGWQEDMVEVYKNLDIVVCTSNNEGTPVSLIEAMTFGLPIVSTDVGGIRDMLCGFGFHGSGYSFKLVEKGNLNGLIKAIKEVIDNLGLFKERSKEMKKVCYNRYRKERLIEDIKQLYGG